MRTHSVLIVACHAVLVAAALCVVSPVARAQSAAHSAAKADSGMLVIYEGLTPVANERFAYQVEGDSLMITAVHRRQLVDEQKQKHMFEKSMLLVVDARDLGLRRYLSNQSFQGRLVVRGLLVTDTVFTYYSEEDGIGNASRIAQPPGRLFVFDSALFTLFDVVCRSLAGKEFEKRPLQLVEMAQDSLMLPAATVTQLRPDTLQMGTVRVPTRRYVLDDAGVRFDLWADRQGRMMRVRHEASGLRVERAMEPAPATKPATKPRRTSATKR